MSRVRLFRIVDVFVWAVFFVEIRRESDTLGPPRVTIVAPLQTYLFWEGYKSWAQTCSKKRSKNSATKPSCSQGPKQKVSSWFNTSTRCFWINLETPWWLSFLHGRFWKLLTPLESTLPGRILKKGRTTFLPQERITKNICFNRFFEQFAVRVSKKFW